MSIQNCWSRRRLKCDTWRTHLPRPSALTKTITHSQCLYMYTREVESIRISCFSSNCFTDSQLRSREVIETHRNGFHKRGITPNISYHLNPEVFDWLYVFWLKNLKFHLSHGYLSYRIVRKNVCMSHVFLNMFNNLLI